MAKMIQILGFRCERCEHEWVPREKNHDPKVCPKCKSPYWDTPRQSEKNNKRKTGGPRGKEAV